MRSKLLSYVLITLAALLSFNMKVGGVSENPISLPRPDLSSPLRLQVEPVTPSGGPSKRLKTSFQVSIHNVSSAALLVCLDNWDSPAGLLDIDVYDSEGEKLRPREEPHIDLPIDEANNLAVLDPGEKRTGVMDLEARGREYKIKTSTYYVVATYFCPFKGERTIDGRKLAIATGKQYSVPKRIAR